MRITSLLRRYDNNNNYNNIIKTNNKELQLQKQLIDTNGRPLAESIGQQHILVGKYCTLVCMLKVVQ